MGLDKCVGRVGALTVALALGVAIVDSPAIALADPGSAASTGSSGSASTASSGGPPSSSGYSSSTGPPSTDAASTPDETTTNPPEPVGIVDRRAARGPSRLRRCQHPQAGQRHGQQHTEQLDVETQHSGQWRQYNGGLRRLDDSIGTGADRRVVNSEGGENDCGDW